MNSPVRRTQNLALISLLGMGCFFGGLFAEAKQDESAASASNAGAVVKRGCPSRGEVDAVLGQASILMGQSRFLEASVVLQPLTNTACDARVSLLLAAVFEGQGAPTKATAELERAHLKWPSNNSVAASLAREYLNEGDAPKAAKALSHFHATADTPAQEMRMAVLVYLAAHQLVAAQTVAEAAYRTCPSVSTLLLLANALQMQGRYSEVNRLLGNVRSAYSDSPEYLVTFAESEFDASRYSEARVDLARAVALAPNLYQAHYLFGNVLFKQGSLDDAVTEYRKAIVLSPSQPRTYFQLALALQAKQDHAGEQTALEQALATDGHYAPAQCEIGRILLEEHRPAEAVEHLNVAVESNPRSEKAYFLLARAYGQMGEKEKSNQMVKQLLAVKKENQTGTAAENEDQPGGARGNGPTSP
jgi:tetratricopeptide (TPR) repeat protein